MEVTAYYDGNGYFASRTVTKGSPYGQPMGIDRPQVVGDENRESSAVFQTETPERIGGLGRSPGQVKTEAGIRPLFRGSSSCRQKHTVDGFYVGRRVFETCGCLVEGKLLLDHGL